MTSKLLDLINSRANAHAPLVRGAWSNIQIKPDLATGEILNAGVMFVDESRRVHLRMADDFEKLTCFYGQRVDVASFERLSTYFLQTFNGQLEEEVSPNALSQNLLLSDKQFASGETVSDILDSLFSATVTLASDDHSDTRRTRNTGVSSNKFQSQVVTILQNRMGVRFRQFIPKPFYEIGDSRPIRRKLDIPIRKEGTLSAALVSVWTKDQWKRKYSLTNAGLDLGTIHSAVADESLGLFVLRPNKSAGYSDTEMLSIDNEIDEVSWKMKQQLPSLLFEVGESKEALAADVENWIGDRAA